MLLWYEFLEVTENIAFIDDEDQIIWGYSSNGKYSVQSLYAVVNHSGVIPAYVHTVWKLHIPPRVQNFLWLLSKNRLLARDNLAKWTEVLDQSCVFHAEKESVDHLFFQCCVAKRIWHIVLTMLNLFDDCNYETVASGWLANKHQNVNNIICATVMCCLWKLRNDLCSGDKMEKREAGVAVDSKNAAKVDAHVQAGNNSSSIVILN